MMNQNPLLRLQYGTPHNTFPFAAITPARIEEAVMAGIEQEMAEVEAIANNAEAPTFDNTIVALEHSGALLERATTVMYNQLSANTSDELEELAQRLSPILSEHSSNIMLNERLFARVKSVKESAAGLDAEEEMLLNKTYEGFERCGACLSDEAKARFREITAELSKLSLQFDQNRIKETKNFILHLTEERELDGIPASRREAAAAAAREKGLDGWVFTLHAPSFGPFMRYSNKPYLRREMYMASNTRCTHDDEYNNYEICRRIVNLRLEKARLLGYETYADFVLKKRMAQNTSNVNSLLQNLIDNYMPTAKREVEEMEAFAGRKLEAWDLGYYSHLLKLRDYNVDAEMSRPYLQLENVVSGVFGLATRLYGITFRENPDIPVYHPEVKAYEVFDADRSFLAVLYTDFFPRENKQSGAWMTSYREQCFEKVNLLDSESEKTSAESGNQNVESRNQGDESCDKPNRNGSSAWRDVRPHVSIVTNFSKPVPASDGVEGKPSLLTLGEVETLLHEFGHALHGIFARTRFASLSGTNVYWDIVELPSQFMENYALEPEFLHSFARHYVTGEPFPDELLERVRRGRNFQVAYACIRQVSLGLLDMSYYTLTEPLAEDIKSHEEKAWQSVTLIEAPRQTCMSVVFGHIMSGGYAAGYYSYKWAEVHDADAFEAFRESGIFSREKAAAFRNEILAKGGTVHPAILYRNFRGHDATIDALLRRDGIQHS